MGNRPILGYGRDILAAMNQAVNETEPWMAELTDILSFRVDPAMLQLALECMRLNPPQEGKARLTWTTLCAVLSHLFSGNSGIRSENIRELIQRWCDDQPQECLLSADEMIQWFLSKDNHYIYRNDHFCGQMSKQQINEVLSSLQNKPARCLVDIHGNIMTPAMCEIQLSLIALICTEFLSCIS